MPRKSTKPVVPAIPTDTYWARFLMARGLLSAVTGSEEQPASREKPEETEELSRGVFTFIYRVAERLTPLDGLSQEARSRALKVRAQFQRELTDVFLGKADFNQWFNKIKTQHGLRAIELIQILYDATEGLTDPEARKLRAEYEATLKRMSSAL
jgi:hypothetical protein